jgi:cell wall-associated NlpC family hydrolase
VNYQFLFPLFLFGLMGVLLTGCGVYRTGSQPSGGGSGEPPALISASPGHSLSSVQEQLRSAHSEWKGTPYAYGGSSQNGIDCSSLTQIVFRDFFDLDLPRNTSQQLQTGSGVRRSSIRPGDLIFFRTSRGMLHVGIAMGGGDFLHASVSSGVMISNLSESYWAGRYLGARRIF